MISRVSLHYKIAVVMDVKVNNSVVIFHSSRRAEAIKRQINT